MPVKLHESRNAACCVLSYFQCLGGPYYTAHINRLLVSVYYCLSEPGVEGLSALYETPLVTILSTAQQQNKEPAMRISVKGQVERT